MDSGKAQRHLTCAQGVVPALTCCLGALDALHGEQQRPAVQAAGMWQRARSMTPDLPAVTDRHLTH
jgi:hypothetical protein